MTKIEEFLRTFEDQRLANLQAATEDGKLRYYDSCNCLLHFKSGNYAMTKSMGPGAALAQAAEKAFCKLAEPYTFLPEIDDSRRCEALLPLIHAEWVRRLQERDELIEEATRPCIEDDAILSRGAR